SSRVAWFEHDKFGLFIHWGLYSIAGGYWDGRRVPGAGEWIMKRGQIPVARYERLAAQFNPRAFDADAWAQLAVDSGMKYVVITAKHHEGFALFASKASRYNSVDATPFHRDIVGELAAACRRHGLRFGVYYSQAQDWHEPGGAGNDWDFPADAVKARDGSFDAYLRTKSEPQVRELLTNYGPLALLWFDTPLMMAGARAHRFVELVRTLQPGCLIDGRLGEAGDYRSMRDNAIPDHVEPGPWEVPATLNNTWGYRRDDVNWKSPGRLVFNLVDVVSKGGNYLLNVGPTGDGVIPTTCQDSLRAVGRWLHENGAAIYGAGPSPFGEEFGESSRTLRDRNGAPVFLPFKGWRCTTKPGRLFITVFEMEHVGQQGYVVFPAFRNQITAVYALADPKHTPLDVKTTADGRRYIAPLRQGTNPLGTVYVVEYAGGRLER
ncbi:MAG TPA: alpha-L-fucosidase, partial [Opitutaceae bacterium]|nr:alpha-L-fucosidase [Opitutaceae bacterium]